MLNLSAVLEQHTRRRPDAEALVYGDKRLTYAQLNAWANQIANALVASGIRRGDHVALLCPNLPYFPAVYFGILKSGRDGRAAERAAEAARDCVSPARQRCEGDVLFPGDAGASDGGRREGGDRRRAGLQDADRAAASLDSARSRLRRRGRDHSARPVHRRPAARLRDSADEARRHRHHSVYVGHDRAAERRGVDAPEHGRQRHGVGRVVRLFAR